MIGDDIAKVFKYHGVREWGLLPQNLLSRLQTIVFFLQALWPTSVIPL